MPLDMSDIINDPELSSSFTIYRKSGEFILGGYHQVETTIAMIGPVITSSPEDLQQVPEGDRVVNAKSFYSTLQIFRTRTEGTSDEILWNGDRYRVLHVFDREVNGNYFKAIADRMAGN